MKKVLLIAPPYGNLYGGANIKKMQWGFVPYGLCSVGGKLRSLGHQVRIIDATFQMNCQKEMEDIIKKEMPDYLGLTLTTPQVPAGLNICESVKKIDPGCIIVAGGAHPSALPEDLILDNNIDIVVIGEGEITMSQIVGGIDLSGIKGICYKENGTIKRTSPQLPIEDLDKLPFPLYEQLPIERYGTPYMGRSVGIITGRC